MVLIPSILAVESVIIVYHDVASRVGFDIDIHYAGIEDVSICISTFVTNSYPYHLIMFYI